MALSNADDVTLRIAAETEGDRNVTSLATQLEALAKQGGDAAPQFAALAAELRKLESQQKAIDTFTKLKKETGDAAKALEEAQAKAQALGKEFSQAENPSRKLTTEFERAKKAVTKSKDALEQKRLALQATRGQLGEYGISTGDLAGKQVELRRALESTATRARDMGASVTAAGGETAGAGREIDKAGKAAGSAGKDLADMGKEADRTGGIMSGLGAKALGVATAIAGYFGTKFFTGSIKSAAEFESQMSTVGAVTRATADDLELLRTAADQAGTTTRFTATEAAQALENLARAGLDARESVDALPAVLGLAQANGVGLAEASSLVTRAVRGMGLEVAEAGRVADVLTAAAARANTNVDGLGQALAYAAPTAQSLGLSLEDTVAIIGKFADAGIDASRAGTALSGMLAQFSDPASSFRRELAAAGITTTNFNEALAQLAAAGPAGEKAILAVGLNAGPALRALLNQGIESLDELREALHNAEGAAANAAAVMDANLDGATRGLASAWDGLRRSLAEPVLEPLAQALSSLSERMREFVSSGVVAQIGESIAGAFKAASEAFFAFVDRLDVDAVIAKLQAWVSATQDTVTQWSQSLSTASDVAATAFNAIATGVNTLKAAFFGVAGVVATWASNVTGAFATVLEQMARVSDRFKRAAEDVRAISESFASSAETNFARAADAIDDTAASAERLRGSFGDLIGIEREAERQALRTADAIGDVGGAAQDAATDLNTLANAQTRTTRGMGEIGRTAESVADEIAELTRKYREFIALGDTQGAAGVQQQITQLRNVGKQAEETGDKVEDAGDKTKDAGDKSEKTGKQLEGAGEGAKKAAEGAKEAEEATANLGTSLNDTVAIAKLYAAWISKLKSEIAGYSEAALRAVEAAYQSATGFSDAARRIQALTASAQDLIAQDAMGGVGDALREAKDEAAALRGELEEMQSFDAIFGAGLAFAGLRKYIASLQEMKVALAEAKANLAELDVQVEGFNDSVAAGTLSLREQAATLAVLIARAEELGSQQLAGLRSALANVQSQMDRLTDSARSTLSSIRDELDQLDGNYAAIERRRLEQRRADIEDQLAEARAAGDNNAVSVLTEALRELARLEKRKLDDAKARERDQKPERQSGSSGGTASGRGGGLSQGGSRHEVTINLGGSRTTVGMSSAGDVEKLIGALERVAERTP